METSKLAQLWRTSPALVRLGVIASACGVFGFFPDLPSVVRGLGVGFFSLCGPGAAVLIWVKGLPSRVIGPFLPLIGVAVNLLATYIAVLEGVWHPRWELFFLMLFTLASCVARLTVPPSNPPNNTEESSGRHSVEDIERMDEGEHESLPEPVEELAVTPTPAGGRRRRGKDRPAAADQGAEAL